MLKNILFGGESGLSYAANAGVTLLRIFAGVALAFSHGIGKVPEFVGGIFLALGLFTRISSFFIAFTMLVAIVGVHGADPFGKKELAFMYFFVATAFLLKGSGDWSLDSFLRR